MRWIRDLTGRFPERPFYELEELDQECEGITEAFLQARRGIISYPITTDDLTVLIEREVADLDLYAELAEGVEGVTEFLPDARPNVRIMRALSEQPWRENRLRTTLAHELGHVKFHAVLLRFHGATQLSLFGGAATPTSWQCQRDAVLGASSTDWVEWQAGYASGALLMPITPVRRVVGLALERQDCFGPVAVASPVGQELIAAVQRAFQVSGDAARVRLEQLGHLVG